MARGRIDHRGVRFGISVNAGGYAWQHVPDGTGIREVLAPVGIVRKTEPGKYVFSGTVRRTNHQLGLDIARMAFNRFRALAEAITRAEPIGEQTWIDEDGTQPTISGSAIMRVTVSDDECKARIVEYADQFGALWGDTDHGTLRDWQREAADFLNLFDVSLALRPRRSRTRFTLTDFEKRVTPPREGWPQVNYVGNRVYSRIMTIAAEGARVESRNALNQIPTKTDYFEKAVAGTPRERAQMLFAREVNRKLTGGLSWSASLLTERQAAVMPLHTVHLLYLRLWMDTADSEEVERQTTCLNCGRELEGANTTRRKTYCDKRCNWEYHNRRRTHRH